MTSAAPTAPAPVALELAGLIASMADDEFVIGFSDSEWTGIAPLLEEDVAMSSLAQDELGHAAALYGLLAELTGTDADALAYDRAPGDYRHSRLLDRPMAHDVLRGDASSGNTYLPRLMRRRGVMEEKADLADRGREDPLVWVSPPSEPDVRVSRIRLSGRWSYLREG